MIKSTISTLLLVFAITFSFAQTGWNWPEDPNLKSEAMERQAYYKLLIAQSKHQEAMTPLNWLYENNPNLNPSIYIQGVECLEAILKENSDNERKLSLQDSILWMFDQRIEYFDNDASTINYKASKAFRLYYKNPKKFKMLEDLFAQAYELNGPEVLITNLNTYMFLAKNYHKVAPSQMTAEKVLDIHSLVSETIETKKKNGGNVAKLDKEQSKTDAWLSSIDGILTCEFIEEKLVPKFKENPTDLNTAKKIYKYSQEAKCTGQPYFLEAVERLFEEQPSSSLANSIGGKYLSAGELSKSLEYFKKAEELASSNDEKYEAFIGQAVANSKLGNKSRSRSLAYEALSAKPGSSQAYNLIGNLYFTSFDDCKQEKSQIEDRAIFIAAYDMYKKAGNSSQMAAAKAQFPSIEDIFNEGKQEGDELTIGCWINTTIKLIKRD